jgi:hypothetical protein
MLDQIACTSAMMRTDVDFDHQGSEHSTTISVSCSTETKSLPSSDSPVWEDREINCGPNDDAVDECFHTPKADRIGNSMPDLLDSDIAHGDGFTALCNMPSSVSTGAIVLPPRADWWDDVDTKLAPGLESAPFLTRLLSADLVKHPDLTKSKRPAPWETGESHEKYKTMGACKPDSGYVALWLNVGECSLLSMSQVLDRAALEKCLADDPLKQRLKLLIRAVQCKLPFPGKGAKDADTVGAFFGKGASLTRSRTADGSDVVVAQVDLYSLRLLRFALQNVGFRTGNVVDIILVDWPGQAVFAAMRLAITDDFVKLIG